MHTNTRNVESNADELIGADGFLAQIKLHQRRLEAAIASRMDSRLSSRFDPADVVQETMLRAVKQLSGVAIDPRLALYPWLYKIAMNCLIDLRRRHLKAACRSIFLEFDSNRYGELFGVPGAVDDPSESMELMERDGVLLQAVAQLNQVERDLIRMRILEEQSVAQVARALRCTQDAVKSRQYRLLKRLHHKLRGRL